MSEYVPNVELYRGMPGAGRVTVGPFVLHEFSPWYSYIIYPETGTPSPAPHSDGKEQPK